MSTVLPNDFEQYFRARWCDKDVDILLQGLDKEPSTSIRLNARRLPVDTVIEGDDGRVPWCPEGVYLKERPMFTADPLMHAGAYYVQEASSMFLAHVLRSILPSSSFATALDLCAAPGGKSTILRSLLPDDCLFIANEPLRPRAQVLAENMAKWGHPNVIVTQSYAAEITDFIAKNNTSIQGFDLILADVPCSGEGMMRKESEAVRQWSPSFVAECASLQRSIVADIWPALRPDGILIYSTCTFNPEEDEDNVEWIARELGADIIPIPVDPTWGIRGDMRKHPYQPSSLNPQPSTPNFCHFLPGLVRGEGFFLAVLRKKAEAHENDGSIAVSSPNEHRKQKKEKGKGHRNAPPMTLADRVRSSLSALPTNQLDSTDAPCVDLTLVDAIRYLQREVLILPPDAPRGIVQVCYCGQRLGLVKNLGTRANNLYPKEWRIRTTHLVPHSLIPEILGR